MSDRNHFGLSINEPMVWPQIYTSLVSYGYSVRCIEDE